ncbi:ASCH domain-containing protein [Roseateles sp. DAIF2]|uniref:ASCH domain-containing protein n=1 Tax=Roseateles sp. DAIF2 TaxID=2714952 RepID=UPI0018A2F516|nr:ASCH domain-containing protein [Roseateles sp. DAIF2]QPF72042.1 ASCH domain-containing protein [Roseateles sp. DAIF2]
MPIPPHLSTVWHAFAASTASGSVDAEHFYEAFAFGDSEALANELAALVLQGAKRATASSAWSFEVEGRRPPRVGDLSIVTDWSGERALCIIETQAVDVVPFDEVSAEFAALEGEGDGSLEFWRQGHRAYFGRECARAGREFSERMPVVCERFALVYRPG